MVRPRTLREGRAQRNNGRDPTYTRIRTIKISSLATGICVLFLTHSVGALPVEDLYSADVLVIDESASQLNIGARAGLLQVLVRISGTPSVASSSLIRGAQRNPSAYYSQYSYGSTDKTLLIDGELLPARVLRVDFEPSAIARLLRRAAFPVWGSNRPSVLLWIAASDGEGRRILGESDSSEFAEKFRKQARLRGVTLLFPLLDLDDASSLSTAEVWGSFLDRVDDASQRYSPDCVLTGRLQVDSRGRWTANWSYRLDGQWQVLDSASYSVEEIVQVVVDRLASDLAARYALDSSRGTVMLRVDTVDSLADYAEVSRYLASLTPVLDSFVVQVARDEVQFRLSIEGQRTQLIEIIELDEKLSLVSTTPNALHYHWLPR